MNVEKMIKELQKMGFKVDARRRTDGGWIITKINDMSFTGASGNQYARQVLGVELSQARIEQTSYNVQKFIKGSKKPKDQISEEMERSLKKVQRIWRKEKVQAHITKKKLRWHLKNEGEEAAKKYLERMTKYGKGLAYEESIAALESYLRDVAKTVKDSDLAEGVNKLADRVREKAADFKEIWIQKILSYFYEARQYGYDNNAVAIALQKSWTTIE